MRIGYFSSSEEFAPRELVTQAHRAEDAGFQGLWVSYHYHPWNGEQGHSGFVWSTIAALAQATSTMNVTTAVTCPTVRIHLLPHFNDGESEAQRSPPPRHERTRDTHSDHERPKADRR
jgi:hypothetical protein